MNVSVLNVKLSYNSLLSIVVKLSVLSRPCNVHLQASSCIHCALNLDLTIDVVMISIAATGFSTSCVISTLEQLFFTLYSMQIVCPRAGSGRGVVHGKVRRLFFVVVA